MKARDVGFEVVYEGIRLTPEQIVKAAEEEGVHLIGLSVLSGSHLELVEDAMRRLEKVGSCRRYGNCRWNRSTEDEANLKSRASPRSTRPRTAT